MTQVNEAQNTASEPKPQSVEDLEYIAGLHAKTRAMNRTLSPVLERAEAEAIAKLEAAKASQ